MPQHVIVDAFLAPALTEVISRREPGIRCWVRGSAEIPGLSYSELDVTRYSGDGLDQAEQQPVSATDLALHIYTSGTTGLPKAANVSHLRLLEWSYWFAGMMNVGERDRLYNCLPMYHSTGGVVAIGAMLFGGGSVVIRPSFSASRFWEDATATRCTIFQYIGELCRYLVNHSADPYETQHYLRLCSGNGMRADVWEGFQRRFRIPQILEFYASTEGNVSLYNCEGKPGSIGKIPAFLAHRFPVALVKCDETGEPLRDDDGYCIRCAADEPGEAIGKIVGGADARMSQFDGYTDKAASAAKVLRDVFSKGDAWFRTGDLLRRDGAGFFYFLDRIGDTFRWKSENVSTTEVEEVICGCAGVRQAIVYGVAVPGTEGRAGMAAIVVSPDFSLLQLREHLAKRLPAYARPLFVRVCEALPMTGTFKHTKMQFVREAFDPAQTSDDLYFDDRAGGAFVQLSLGLHSAISRGELRL